MSKQIIPSGWKNCATCRWWDGERHPNDPWCNNVVFENSETGTCYGKGFHMANMQPMASCSYWEEQYKK